MILADKIIDERKKNGWSQEELAEKLGVSRQAVSKWESAQSIPDLQRVIAMANLFGVSTDYLLKEEMETAPVVYSYQNEESDSVPPLRRVTMEEANEFLEMKRKGAGIIANGVLMCILSPALLILLAGFADSGVGPMSENMAAGIGLVALFGLIATAVYQFITYGTRAGRMEYLEKENFETEYGITGMVREKKASYEGIFTRGIAVGVVMCIVACVPLIVVALMEAPDYVCCIFVDVLLLIIAIAVNIMIRVGMIYGSYETLLQEGEYTSAEKRARNKLDPLSGLYWCLITAIYLGWSFWTGRWDFTWIIWPVAGVASVVFHTIARIVMRVD